MRGASAGSGRWGRRSRATLRLPVAQRRDLAVCVRQWDWSETSQTVLLFGRELGLIRGLAKGSRRPRSAFSGGIEPLTAGELHLLLRPAVDLQTLTAWDLTETFPGVRASLRSHYAGLYFADLIARAMGPADPHPAAYDALVAALRALNAPANADAAVLRFQWVLLTEAGLRPSLDRLLDGGPLPAGATLTFDPVRGGLSGPADDHASQTGADWRVRRSTIDLLRSLESDSALAPIDPATESLPRAARFLAAYWRHALGEQVPTLATLYPDLDRTPNTPRRTPG